MTEKFFLKENSNQELQTVLGKSNSLLFPFVHIQEYSLNEILDRRLYFFLPFYMMRYEKDMKDETTDKDVLMKQLDEDFQKIEDALLNCFMNTNLSYCYTILNELINGVLDQIIPSDKEIRDGVDYILEQHMIQIPSAVIYDEGVERGIEKGIAKGVQRGRAEAAAALVKDGILSLEEAVNVLGLNGSEVEKFL